MNSIKLNVTINNKAIAQKIDSLLDESTMIEVHDLLSKMCDPYVPMDEGPLSQHIEITKEGVRYREPYAHYQYIGEVYGPNIPVKDKEGNIIRWFSIPGMKKNPTGRPINYNKEKHALATHHWDEAMIRDKGDVFLKGVQDILIRRAKELLNGGR